MSSYNKGCLVYGIIFSFRNLLIHGAGHVQFKIKQFHNNDVTPFRPMQTPHTALFQKPCPIPVLEST